MTMTRSDFRRSRPRLETLEAREVPAAFTVTSALDAGTGTLRQALLDANNNGNPAEVDIIRFALVGGPAVIRPTSPLPVVTESLVIDGYSQPGAKPNDLADGNNAVLAVVLDGGLAGDGANGLVLAADSATVSGLVISGFSGNGLVLSGTTAVVTGSFIGTDRLGTSDVGNGTGILVAGTTAVIGGDTAGGRNVISGNSTGILVADATDVTIRNSYVGTDLSGTLPLGNDLTGVSAVGSGRTTIGGTDPVSKNVISANGRATLASGVRLEAGNVAVLGNVIGASVTGAFSPPLGNGLHGVEVHASGVVIGGVTPEEGNLIASNGGSGVAVLEDAVNVRISHNRIAFDAVGSIDLGGDGPTANDALDADAGPNGLQNSPVITYMHGEGNKALVTGTLHGSPNATFQVELFAGPPSGAFGGTGTVFLGLASVQTDAAGNGTFGMAVFRSAALVPAGFLFSATATDTAGNTSEFSTGVAALEVVNRFAVGSDAGEVSRVQTFDADGTLRLDFVAYPGFLGGVRVATGDVTGDGVDDVITGAGAGAGPHVKVFNGTTGALVASFFAYDVGFVGGVFVAAGDLDGDGRAEILTGAGINGHVKAFDATGAERLSFLAYENFAGAVTVSAGDVDGDGRAEIITGAAAHGHVKVFDAAANERQSFFAYLGFMGAVNVASGDLDGDGRDEILTGAGIASHVKAFSAVSGELTSFQAFEANFNGGVRVAAADVDGDGRDEILAAPGPGRPAQVSAFDLQAAPRMQLAVLDAVFADGVFVA